MNSVADIWKIVLSRLSQDLSETTISTWFDEVEAVSIKDRTLYLHCPNDFKRSTIESMFSDRIKDSLRDIYSADFDVKLLSTAESTALFEPEVKKSTALLDSGEFTFDTFVVGESNKMAYAAARAVELMGDPEETGKALREQYRHFWLVIVQRAARILTALLCVMIAGLIVKSSGLYGAIRDRYEVQKPGEGWERWNTETPGTRIPIGDDIVRIDTVSCSTQRAEVQLTAFDRIPGGVVYARLLHTLRLENERGEAIDEWEDCDYPSCVSSSGTLYVCIASHRVNIEPDRLGEHVEVEIPLPGREAQP